MVVPSGSEGHGMVSSLDFGNGVVAPSKVQEGNKHSLE